jgi:hypothetical protein
LGFSRGRWGRATTREGSAPGLQLGGGGLWPAAIARLAQTFNTCGSLGERPTAAGTPKPQSPPKHRPQQSMMASPYVRPFAEDVRQWEQKLSLISETIEVGLGPLARGGGCVCGVKAPRL